MITADDVAAAVLAELGPMEAMKLQKLVYYSQAWHVAITGRPLFPEDVEAWAQGPVVDSLYQRHRGRRRVHSWPDGDPSELQRRATDVVKLVCAEYGHKSGDELSTLTHDEEPWRVSRGSLPAGARSRSVIDLGVMRRCYRKQHLRGRTAVDLAAGGGTAVYPGLTDEVMRGELATLRESYRCNPVDEPAPTPVIGYGQAEWPDELSLSGVVRTRTRTRP